MYSRTVSESPESIVADGTAQFGTFSNPPQKLDIKGIKAPFGGIPIPAFLTNFRIKSRLAYMFSIGDYIGMVEFFDDKLFGLAEVIFWYRSAGKKFVYNTFMLPRFRFVPIRLDKAACINHKKSRYIRISWNRKRDRISLVFSVKGDASRPAATGMFVSHFSDPLHAELVVVAPAPTTRRCSASWLTAMCMEGSLNVLAGKKTPAVTMQNTSGLAFMVMNRTYYRYHSKSKMMCGLGDYEGRKLLFRFTMTNMDSEQADDCNENVVVFDGKPTPMPAVTITHPFGSGKTWIVQDTETMIDLTFTPVSISKRVLSILVMRTDYSTIFGTFDGVLFTGTGEKLTLKNFPGIVKKSRLRI
ncbi:DUF2804 domain-containing protein [Treponema socranskii]|uniref:DUF2804 family protein n=1 Tax=Treponema socranskii TaxID=53419 RepID=UPI003D6E5047